MMFGPIRAIAIDDEPKHLLSITTGLSSLGIPSIGYWFNQETSKLFPHPPPNGLEHLRVIFCDLNLMPGGPQDAITIWTIFVGCLRQVLSKKSGPYLLVFWTGVGTKSDDVERLLFERAEQLDGIPLPVKVLKLKKGEFLASSPEGRSFSDGLSEFYSDLHSQIRQMQDQVEAVVKASANLNVMSGWETRAAVAASCAINEVHRCAHADTSDPSVVESALTKILSKIAVAASGPAAAQSEPARALDAGLLDILVDQIGSTVEDQDYKDKVKAALDETLSGEINFSDSVAIYAELNTFFHVDRENRSLKTSDRGVVVPIQSLRDSNSLGFNPNEVLTSEFLFPHELFPEEQHPQIQEDLRLMRRGAKFVLVEIGADCDHAQNNDGTRRYLTGLEIPRSLLHLATLGADGKLRNGALELFGPWKIGGEVKYLLISYRRFCTWQKRTPPPGSPLYRLRASLVDKLLHRYSSWSSRPGIVEFR